MAGALRIGTDIVSVPRFARALERHGDRLLRRVFTDQEVRYAMAKRRPAESLAARFAAKEACFKAVGVGWPKQGVTYHDVEVVRGPWGPPTLALRGRVGELAHRLGASRFHVSLSHTDEMALAVVLLEGGAAAAREG